METLLAAVDIERISNGYLSCVGKLANKLGATVWVVYVAQPHPDVVELAPDSDWENASLCPEHEPLREVTRSLQALGVDARPVLMQGPVVESLLEAARELAASMILVNSHGHGPLYDVLVGSVAEGVTGSATCPVLWVPSAWVDR